MGVLDDVFVLRYVSRMLMKSKSSVSLVVFIIGYLLILDFIFLLLLSSVGKRNEQPCTGKCVES